MSWIWWLLTFEFRWLLQLFLIILTCAAMLRWGGGPERALAWGVSGLIVVDRFYHAIWGNAVWGNEWTELYHTLQDGTLACVFLLIALYANRTYPMFIAAFQLISLIGHFLPFISGSISKLTTAIVIVAPAWGILFTMMVGFAFYQRRLRQTGPIRDWRDLPVVISKTLGRTGIAATR